MLCFRRKLNRRQPLHPPALPAAVVPLERQPAMPHDYDSVNVTLGPLPEKYVEPGKSGAIKSHISGSGNDPSVVQH
jgi:hypothetical protein